MSLTLLLSSVGLLLIISQLCKNYWYNWRYLQKIPGPNLPFLIGNTLQFFKSSEEIFESWRQHSLKYFPIYRVWNFHNDIVSLMDPQDIKTVLTTDRCTKDLKVLYPWLGQSLVAANGSSWRLRRKLLDPGFSLSKLQKSLAVFNKKTTNLLKSLEQSTDLPVNVPQAIGAFTLSCILEIVFGHDNKSTVTSADFLEKANRLNDLWEHRLTRPWLYSETMYKVSNTYKNEQEIIEVLHKLTRDNIDKKRNCEESDRNDSLLDLLVKAANDGKFKNDEIFNEVNGLLAAGYSTLKDCLTFLLMLVANHPDVQNRLVGEINSILEPGDECAPTYQQLQTMHFMEACIKESLRLYPNISMISRKASKEIKTHTGYIIPEKTIMLIQFYDVHHNPTLYPNPETFNPDRFLENNRTHYSYLPFGAGPRKCIGQKFAMLEIKIALCAILRKFILIPVDTPDTIKLSGHFIMKTNTDIKIKFKLRT